MSKPIEKTLVQRLDAMANGWLCASLPDADLPREAAREIERLNAELLRVQSYINETPELFEALGPIAMRTK